MREKIEQIKSLSDIPKGWTVHQITLNAGRIVRLEFERFQTYYTANFDAGKVTLERGQA